jgi:outer membrane receptor protein involved in Fe transport
MKLSPAFLLLLNTCGALFAPHVFAQTSPATPAQELPTIEVVGTAPQSPLPVQRDRLPFNVQVSSDEALQKTKPESIADFLTRSFTGVSVNGIQGSPFQADISYRGFRLSPILGTAQGLSAFVDGVRINEAFGDVVYWEMIPEMAISRVALMPGSNPLFGLNTLGGALALTTKNGRQHPGVTVDVNAGSFKRARTDFSMGHDFGVLHAFVAGTAFRDGGWRDDSQGKLGNVFAKLGGASYCPVCATKMARLKMGFTKLIGARFTPHPTSRATSRNTTRSISRIHFRRRANSPCSLIIDG